MSGAPAREIYWLEQTNTQRKIFCESHTAYINSRPDFVFKLKLVEPVTPEPPVVTPDEPSEGDESEGTE